MVHAPAVLAEATLEAETWDDAISKIDCKDIGRNADGSYSVTGVIKLRGEIQHNPIINVPRLLPTTEEMCEREAFRAR